jgi:arsenate reductase
VHELTLHGIRNCDTMKKARAWLDAHRLAYRFHDYKVDGISAELLARWCNEVGWEALVNRAGTTFRKLPEADRQGLDESRAIALMLHSPSLIRRPVLALDGRILVGFQPDTWSRELGHPGKTG